jgi:gamma-glutamyl:cysteine ligase YbdK (ATP-grasp superfamily)
MNLQESIRRILKEETSLSIKLKNLIDNKGIDMASTAVGGIKNVAKILNLDLDDVDTQEMLVKNFIYHTKIDQIDVLFIEVRSSGSGSKILTINLKTDDTASNVTSWYVHEICNYFNGRQDSPELNKTLFPFKVKPAWHPVFELSGCKIFLDAKIVDEEEEDEEELTEKWSEKYKKSINCNNPKGFSQKAHCAGKHKKNEIDEYARTLKNARQQGVGLRFPKSAIKSNPARFRPYNR